MNIVFYAPINMPGYSQVVNLIMALQKKYSNIGIIPLSSIFEDNLYVKEKHIGICCAPPTSFQFPKTCIEKYGFTMFEAEIINENWINAINTRVNFLLVPNEWNKNVFMNNSVNVPIDIINYNVDLDKFNHDDNVNKYDKFTFLFIGEFIDRKGVKNLINAFCLAFNRNPNVALILKQTTPYQESSIKSYVESKHYGNVDIRIISRKLKENEMIELYQKSHCFVTATKGEGVGMPIYEAICCGTPVVIPRLNVFDNIDNKCSWKVDLLDEKYKPQKNQIIINKAYKNCYFSCIDIDMLSKTLLNVYKNQKERISKSKNCLKACNKYGLDKSIKQFEKIFKKYLK